MAFINPMSRERKLLYISGSLLLVTAGIFGSIFFLQHQLSNSTRHHNYVPRISQQQEDALTERAKLLREKWRSWALAHKTDILSLVKGNGKEDAPVMKVYDELPDYFHLEEGGLLATDLKVPPHEFTWNVLIAHPTFAPQLLSDPAKLAATKQSLEESRERMKARLRHNNLENHDIAICDSMNPGDRSITFWVSGRITQSTYDFDKKHPQGTGGEDRLKEVAPQYDFLE